MDKKEVTEVFRAKMLAALDAAVNETFKPPHNRQGAADQDLPRLFKALDIQIYTLARRYGVVWTESD